MPYRVSHAARQGLEEIFEYWATHASSHGADRVLESISDRFWLLGEFPRCGKRIPDAAGGLFCFPAGNYLIYYRWSRRGTDIIHIFHGSRDQRRALKPPISPR